ncbi:AAA family ATPase [Candidatus Dojkabacteria bacterium]|nr:AAA family ATPase [Candidatus Dojkabacteria bacterium]
MKHLEISEIISGLVLTGKMSPDYVIPSYLAAPYDIIVAQSKEGKTPAELLDMVGLMPITAARDAASMVKFTESTITELLTTLMAAYRRQEQSAALKEQIKVLERGDNLETDKLVALMDKTEDYKGKYIKMSEVEDTSPIWRKIYYEPIDTHVGDPADIMMTGVPESGLTIIGGPPGTGKTSLIASMIAGCAEAGKKVLVYTLEMTTGQIARRIIQVATNNLTMEQRSNVIICGEILSADEVYADAMRLCATMNIYAVFIDFSDLLIEREEDEQSMAYVYRRCAMLAKRNTVGAPVILLSQLNRQYTGGIPRINNLRYSGLAEALGALIFLIYNPNQIFATQGSDDRLPAIPGRGYIIVGKSRFGYREGSPGAIQVDFDGKTSWGRNSYGWFSLSSV